MNDFGTFLEMGFASLAGLQAIRWYADWRTLQAYQHRRAQRQMAKFKQQADLLWQQIRELFPYIPSFRPTVSDATDMIGAIRQHLEAQPCLGHIASCQDQAEALVGLPVPGLPLAERLRHCWLIGKTGGGKSTFNEHLIAGDLQRGHGVCVIAPEGDLFDRLLALVPTSRWDEVVYFAPGNPQSTMCLNPFTLEPGQDPVRAAEDVFTALRRTFADDNLGPRMIPILANATALLMGQPNATLWEIGRLLGDQAFREATARQCADEYVRSFWLETFPRFAEGADLPILSRLDQFLRAPAIRKALCQPTSSFSIAQVLQRGQILFVDLHGLSEPSQAIINSIVLSRIQLEGMRRELTGESHKPFCVFIDELQVVAALAESSLRQLLSRARKYGLALTLSNQWPGQLGNRSGLFGEIVGNVKSIVAFNVSSHDAGLLKSEVLQKVFTSQGERIQPISEAVLLGLKTGEAVARLAGGYAVKIKTLPPVSIAHPERAKALIEHSWKRLANPVQAVPAMPPITTLPARAPTPTAKTMRHRKGGA